MWNCPPSGFGGGWGPPKSPLPGVSVSLCVSVSLTVLSQSCPCVSVFAKLPHFGARLSGARGGKVAVSSAPGLKGPFLSCLPHLIHPTRLCSPDCPGLCPSPHFYQHFASTLSGSSPLWKCGSELSLSIQFGPRKLKSKETWLMACDLNLDSGGGGWQGKTEVPGVGSLPEVWARTLIASTDVWLGALDLPLACVEASVSPSPSLNPLAKSEGQASGHLTRIVYALP